MIATLISASLVIGCSQPPKTNPATEVRTDPYWVKAYQEVYRSAAELKAQEERERRRGLVLPTLRRGSTSQKSLALTFDDGPHPTFTPRLLAFLKKEKVPATFFVVGKMAEKYPSLIRQIDASGHLVGNHTFSHVTLTKIPIIDIATEYRACNDLIERIIGKRPRWCRPPGGDYDKDVIDAATANGMTTVLWTDDPGDYASPGNTVITQRTLSRLSNGGILLMHDGIEQTLKVLPQIIETAQKRGFKFVRVDQLARSKRAS